MWSSVLSISLNRIGWPKSSIRRTPTSIALKGELMLLLLWWFTVEMQLHTGSGIPEGGGFLPTNGSLQYPASWRTEESNSGSTIAVFSLFQVIICSADELSFYIHSAIVQNAGSSLFMESCSAEEISFLNEAYGISHNQNAVLSVSS